MKDFRCIVKVGNEHSLRVTNSKPEGFLTNRFEGIYSTNIDHFDIVRDSEGWKAVFNQDKFNTKESERIARVDQESQRNQTIKNRSDQLKQSLASFDNLTAAQKWSLVKKLMEHVLGE